MLYKAEQYVKNKYRALSPSMQYVLRGSSVIGYEFSKALLTNPLKMLLVDSQLRRIEYQTHIIRAKDEDLFEFHDNTSHLSIRNIVSPEEYLKWNILLAGYFFDKAQNSQSDTDSIEMLSVPIIYLSKSAYYFSAAEQKEKTALIYLRLAPLLISIMDYEKALSVISNLHHLYDTDHLLISSSDMHHLYLLEGDCYYSLFQYNSAVISYKHYSEMSFITKFEFLAAQCQYAFALYCAGETEGPYSLLQNVYHELDDEKNKKSAEIKVRALSFISSIEETIWNGKHIEHYNQALALAKEYKLYNEYYQLLRKALIAYKGKTGIRLMSTARDYYKQTNNIKEYAMCLHNIAIELLYHGDLEQAKINLEESITIFQSFGSDGAHCPINALGDYWAIKGNFRKAISCYIKAYDQQCDLFSQIGILINLSTAHRGLHQCRKAAEYLKSVEGLLSDKQADNYAILKQHYYLSIALTDTECGRYEHAYKAFLQYFDCESNRDSHRMTIASRALYELCNITKYSFPEEYEDYIIKDSSAIERLAPHQLVLVRLSFAE